VLTDAMFEMPSGEEQLLEVNKEYALRKLSKTLLKELKAAS
jgi:ATP-dependent Clp protease ATP-binding subunit ClpX